MWVVLTDTSTVVYSVACSAARLVDMKDMMWVV